MAQKKSKELMDFLFGESQEIESKESDINKLVEDAESLERLDGLKPELVKLLTALGIEKPSDRLLVKPDKFSLATTCQIQARKDADILFDLTKISDLIDKGYVIIQGEPNKVNDEIEYHLSILNAAPSVDSDFKPEDLDKLLTKANEEAAGEQQSDDKDLAKKESLEKEALSVIDAIVEDEDDDEETEDEVLLPGTEPEV